MDFLGFMTAILIVFFPKKLGGLIADIVYGFKLQKVKNGNKRRNPQTQNGGTR